MATKTTPAVSVNYDEAGDVYQLGFKLGKSFVPVASVNGSYARALVGQATEGEGESGDGENGG